MLNPIVNKKNILAKEHLAKVFREKNLLTDEGLQKILDLFTFVELKKETNIPGRNEGSNDVYFLSKGMIRACYYKSGKEVIDWFGIEECFFGNVQTKNKRTAGADSYKTIKNTILLKADFLLIEKLIESYPDVEKLINNIILQHYIDYVERVHNYKGLNSADKYSTFVKNYPSIANSVPLIYLANYLGIAPDTLSRIRASTINYPEK